VSRRAGEDAAEPAGWLALERQGDAIRGFSSGDGQTWTLIGERLLDENPARAWVGPVAWGGDRSTGADPVPSSFEPLEAVISNIEIGEIQPARSFIRGDCNDDGTADISDASCVLGWLFLDSKTPGCIAALNTNGDDRVDLSDAVALLNHLFLGGPAPAAPYPDCGPGLLPDDDNLGCDSPQRTCL
jgi:hypothetical protein